MPDEEAVSVFEKGGRQQKLAGYGNPMRLTYVFTEEVTHAKSSRQS
ncbi:MAG TPA: hypothetical protein VKP61_02420 [Candidatus Acidoferrum sp.]|nr:hypothetical protein [Candidatus Acidoferrum sp.]